MSVAAEVIEVCDAPNCDGQWHRLAIVRDKKLEPVRSLPAPNDWTSDEEAELLKHDADQSASIELIRCPETVSPPEESEPKQESQWPTTTPEQTPGPWWGQQ